MRPSFTSCNRRILSSDKHASDRVNATLTDARPPDRDNYQSFDSACRPHKEVQGSRPR